MPAPRLDTPSALTDGLDRYYRDMAAHDLLSPEQEVSLAQEIERREAAAWVELFRYRPALEQVIALLEAGLEDAVTGLDPLKERLAAEPDALERAIEELTSALAKELALLDRQRKTRALIVADLDLAGPPAPATSPPSCGRSPPGGPAAATCPPRASGGPGSSGSGAPSAEPTGLARRSSLPTFALW